MFSPSFPKSWFIIPFVDHVASYKIAEQNLNSIALLNVVNIWAPFKIHMDTFVDTCGATHLNALIESMKTTSMETVSTGVLDKNKGHYLRSKDKAEKSYDVLRHIQLHKSYN